MVMGSIRQEAEVAVVERAQIFVGGFVQVHHFRADVVTHGLALGAAAAGADEVALSEV